jgi:hypothetical protein
VGSLDLLGRDEFESSGPHGDGAADAYVLTDRERCVTAQVARGLSTSESPIAPGRTTPWGDR